MSLLSAAKKKGIELSGINLDKDEVRLFSLLGITGGREKAKLRELVGITRVTTEEKLTDTQQGFLDQAKELNYPLRYVKLEEEEEEDELFNAFGLKKDDVASQSQLRYVVKREQLRANENKLRDEQRKENEELEEAAEETSQLTQEKRELPQEDTISPKRSKASPLVEQGTPKTVDDLVLRFPVKQTKGYSFVLADLINDEVIERQDSLDEVKNLVCKLLDGAVSPQSQNDKEKFPIGCTICGSGGGKSTLCALLEQQWNGEIKETINAHKSVLSGEVSQASLVSTALATFNSTCNYDNDEKNRLSPEASLGIRLVASRNHWSHHDVSVFLNTREEADPYAQLNLKECLKKIAPENENEAVIVLVDEIVKLDDDNVIHDVLLQLSNFQQECLRDSKKLFIVVTSLSSKPPASLTRKTQRQVLPISLPPISAPEVLKQAHQFAEKLIATREDIETHLRDHLITEFCSTGGLVKSMQTVVKFYKDPQNHPRNKALRKVRCDYAWLQDGLACSVFGTEVSSDSSLGGRTVQDLIYDHQVAVVKTVLGPSQCLAMKIRIPVYHLRSIGAFTGTNCTLTDWQTKHLMCVMDTVAENRQSDGSYAKPFEIALMRVLCLRLSLVGQAASLGDILSGCGCHDESLPKKRVERTDCAWVEVQKLTINEVKKQRKHGTMVYSKLSNEGAVEGFWYLIIEEKAFVLFLQMKFWAYCAPKDIAKWEAKIHDRAQKVFGLSKGEYVPLFCSTSRTFKVTSSLALANEATEHLLEPFGICPMMLYNEERKSRKSKKA